MLILLQLTVSVAQADRGAETVGSYSTVLQRQVKAEEDLLAHLHLNKDNYIEANFIGDHNLVTVDEGWY